MTNKSFVGTFFHPKKQTIMPLNPQQRDQALTLIARLYKEATPYVPPTIPLPTEETILENVDAFILPALTQWPPTTEEVTALLDANLCTLLSLALMGQGYTMEPERIRTELQAYIPRFCRAVGVLHNGGSLQEAKMCLMG